MSNSGKDLTVVRSSAKQVRKDALKIWLDDWKIKLVDSMRVTIGAGPSSGAWWCSAIGVCLRLGLGRSCKAICSVWRPTENEHRFMPLELNSTRFKGSWRNLYLGSSGRVHTWEKLTPSETALP